MSKARDRHNHNNQHHPQQQQHVKELSHHLVAPSYSSMLAARSSAGTSEVSKCWGWLAAGTRESKERTLVIMYLPPTYVYISTLALQGNT